MPPVTGLSLPFWRKMVLHKKVKARKVQGAVVILDADLQEFLKGKEEGDESEAADPKQTKANIAAQSARGPAKAGADAA